MGFFGIFKKGKDIYKEEISKTHIKEDGEKKKTFSGNYLMWNLSELDAKDLCKHQIDSMEHWARRLIDEIFKEKYGDNYFESEVRDGQPLVKKNLQNKIEGRMKDNPERFSRKVDALVIEDLEYFFCRDDLYKTVFQEVFTPFYSGAPEIRSVLKRIASIRNKIAHGNPLSQHEIEQGVCYSNDFINVFRDYYRKKGKEREYNVPTFIALTDSLGRTIFRETTICSWGVLDWMLGKGNTPAEKETHLRSGESYRVILEVDSSFPEDFYDIEWEVSYGRDVVLARGSGNIIEFTLDDKVVSWYPRIKAYLKTKRSWHKFANIDCDDYFEMSLSKVYPPIQDD